MIDKDLDQITPSDLQRLVENAVTEGRRLEYKEQLPGPSNDEKKEFLADVSSFANTQGGDLIFGVVEQREGNKPTGVAAAITGVDSSGPIDLLRFENMIRDGLAPRVSGIRLKEVPGFSRGPVLIARIPRSPQRPHMVSFGQSSRFYARNSQGKFLLDVGELRQAFIGGANAREQARSFVRTRVQSVELGDIDGPLDSRQVILVHVVPLSAFEREEPVDLLKIQNEHALIAPLYSTGFRRRFNLDGFATYAASGEQLHSYLQVFRNGALEGATTGMFYEAWMRRSESGPVRRSETDPGLRAVHSTFFSVRSR